MDPVRLAIVLSVGVCFGGAAAAQSDAVQQAVREASDLIAKARSSDAIKILEPVAAQAASDPAGAEVQYLLGQAHYRLARYDQADVFWEQAIAGERAAHDITHEARTMRAIAQMRKNQGRYAEGLAAADDALRLYASVGDPRNVAQTWIVIGAINDLQGNHREAIESYDHAVPVLAGEQTAMAANLSYERAISFKNLGRYSQALDGYALALDIYVRLNDVENQATVLGNMGILYAATGESDRSVVVLHRAIALSRQAANRRFEMIGLLNLASSYWDLGDRPRALDALQQELAIARDIGAKSEEATTLKNLGDIEAADGDAVSARRDYDAALALRRAAGERGAVVSSLVALASTSLGERRFDEARQESDEALTLARSVGRPEYTWGALSASAAVDAAVGRLSDAIAKLRESAQIINDLRGTIAADAGKIAYLDRRRSVFEQLSSALMTQERPVEALEAAEAARARAFADLLEQRRTRTAPPAISQEHELESLEHANTPAISDIAAEAARLSTTFVEYLATPDRLLVWVVGHDGAVHGTAVDVSRRTLDDLTRRVRAAVDSEHGGAGASPRTALRTLDRRLIEPVAAWLPVSTGESLVIIPDGPLFLVPFAALEDSRGRLLIERHAVATAPAASVFAYTGRKRAEADAHAGAALIVADPVPPPGSRASRLPGAAAEGTRIARRIGPGRATLLTGAAATEAALKTDPGRYGLIHIAAHGVILADRPLASSLLLGAGSGEDGYLRVDEIFGLTLAARLVVLSGCSTGLGQLTGDGVIGLTRAFLYAGTPAIVVSKWDVDDRATAVLMERFYAELLRGHGAAQALRAATLATRARFPSVRAWAAFELVGEPQ